MPHSLRQANSAQGQQLGEIIVQLGGDMLPLALTCQIQFGRQGA